MKKTPKKAFSKFTSRPLLMAYLFVFGLGLWIYQSLSHPVDINLVSSSAKSSIGLAVKKSDDDDTKGIKGGKSITPVSRETVTTPKLGSSTGASGTKTSGSPSTGTGAPAKGGKSSGDNSFGDPPKVPAKTTVSDGTSNGVLFDCKSGECVQVKNPNIIQGFIDDVVVDLKLGDINTGVSGLGGKPKPPTTGGSSPDERDESTGNFGAAGSMGGVSPSTSPESQGKSLRGGKSASSNSSTAETYFNCTSGECVYVGPELTAEQEAQLKINLDGLKNSGLGGKPTTGVSPQTPSTPVVPPNPAKAACEAKGYRFVDVAGSDKDSCVNPSSDSCGDLGQNIGGKCYYPGDQIPNSDRVVCDWTHSANNTGRRYPFNSNNCPEKATPNANYVPSTKGDCSGNAGWWDGTKCNIPSLTPLDGSSGSLIVCKGVEAGGQAPKYSYAYISTVAECPWAQEQIKSTCKDIIDPATKECRKRTPGEQEKYCKDTKQVYDSISGKCVPPGTESTPDSQAKICSDQGKKYSSLTPGCVGDFADPSVTIPKDERDDIIPGNIEANGSADAGEKASCSWWERITNQCQESSSSTSTPLSPDEQDELNNASDSEGSTTDTPKCSLIATWFGCKDDSSSDTTALNNMNKPIDGSIEVNQGGGGVFTEDSVTTNNGVQAQIEDFVTKVQEYLKGLISPLVTPEPEMPVNPDQGIRSQ